MANSLDISSVYPMCKIGLNRSGAYHHGFCLVIRGCQCTLILEYSAIALLQAQGMSDSVHKTHTNLCLKLNGSVHYRYQLVHSTRVPYTGNRVPVTSFWCVLLAHIDSMLNIISSHCSSPCFVNSSFLLGWYHDFPYHRLIYTHPWNRFGVSK